MRNRRSSTIPWSRCLILPLNLRSADSQSRVRELVNQNTIAGSHPLEYKFAVECSYDLEKEMLRDLCPVGRCVFGGLVDHATKRRTRSPAISRARPEFH